MTCSSCTIFKWRKQRLDWYGMVEPADQHPVHRHSSQRCSARIRGGRDLGWWTTIVRANITDCFQLSSPHAPDVFALVLIRAIEARRGIIPSVGTIFRVVRLFRIAPLVDEFRGHLD